MQKSKDDQDIEKLMNEKGLSHAEAMKATRKKAPEKKSEYAEEDGEISSEGGEVCLPANLLPEVSVGKEISFNLSGVVTDVSGGMVYVKTKDLHVDVREPYKETKGSIKAVALDR